MPFNDLYRKQVELVVQALPYVSEEKCFALKGGTAINLFIRDLPRLSVDIDLTYLPLLDRQSALQEIEASLLSIANRLQGASPAIESQVVRLRNERVVNKLVATDGEVQIKIEVTPVLRGSVYAPISRTVTSKVEESFGFAEILLLDEAELYGGKIVAALDRQHPRDLFDLMEFLKNGGLEHKTREAFIVYLISHNRPMFEVLEALPKDLSHEYDRSFKGLTDHPVELSELTSARADLINKVVHGMPNNHKEFLVSFEEGSPAWELLNVEDIQHLPAVRWRRQNLDKLDARARRHLVDNLKRVLRIE